MPISRMQQPRQMYGLGSFVKKAIKGVTGAVKKIAGSGLGKAALLGFGANALIPGGLGSLFSGGSSLFGGGGGLTGILSKGKSLLGGLTTGQRLAGSLGLAALASAPQEVQEESSRDIGALKKYLASYYQNLGYSADEIAENVERDTAEYTSGAGGYAEGGRIGYQDGSPEENAIQASGIMNLPLNENPAGITELDLRETGGFIPPVGVKEKADDIPAMLSNNEFVFTADAVRGMGDGNVNKGAQRMYDMMKKLEKGGRV